MSDTTLNGVKTTTNTLYRVPTLTEFDGKESFAYINPKEVATIIPDVITVGREYPGSKEVKGTHLLVNGGDTLFVPMAPAEVAVLLEIELVG